ncbi:hypothetical protein Q762_13100 [Flavobacterium cauense R2A-7]|nr:hypothetical protein Q762_13100 [Flavobacterium cauense R2A-7]
MARNKLFGKPSVRQIIWIFSIVFLLAIIALLYQYKTYFAFLGAPIVIVSVALMDYTYRPKFYWKKNN